MKPNGSPYTGKIWFQNPNAARKLGYKTDSYYDETVMIRASTDASPNSGDKLVRVTVCNKDPTLTKSPDPSYVYVKN